LFSALGLEKKLPPAKSEGASKAASVQPEFTTGTGLTTVPLGLEQALALARTEWGEVPLERIELKRERGEMIYKLKRSRGDELWINAVTGAHFVKGEYERVAKPGAAGAVARQTDWGKILLDLHTGKIGGEAGKAIMSFAALVLLWLTLSGVYMWLKPLLLRRQNARARAATTATAMGAASASPALANSVPVKSEPRELVEV
jgi:uncharacterized iron-regulated membrane protein